MVNMDHRIPVLLYYLTDEEGRPAFCQKVRAKEKHDSIADQRGKTAQIPLED